MSLTGLYTTYAWSGIPLEGLVRIYDVQGTFANEALISFHCSLVLSYEVIRGPAISSSCFFIGILPRRSVQIHLRSQKFCARTGKAVEAIVISGEDVSRWMEKKYR